MVTDNERREVAKKMREYDVAEFKESAIVPFLECLGHGYMDWRGILDELADLIDCPTCELRYDTVHNDWWCSRCGTWYEEPVVYVVDESAAPEPCEMRYCPQCRAEVVSIEYR